MPIKAAPCYSPALCAFGVVAYSLSASAQLIKIILKLATCILTGGQLYRSRHLNTWSFRGLWKDMMMGPTQLAKAAKHTHYFFISMTQTIQIEDFENSYKRIALSALSVPFKGRYHLENLHTKAFFANKYIRSDARPKDPIKTGWIELFKLAIAPDSLSKEAVANKLTTGKRPRQIMTDGEVSKRGSIN